ncbi:hypothetical protein J3R30DRAFT_3290491 [Lentinula aciculospora]|uniref:BRCT domain-containing protein n=1 Tax=Lentinula aciculospora TaxID=153920 RepID=A0A9W9ABG4_9AGAR|nr:hypothetical protein J3R30DRAFT_3290491 [Lentinula aciculospora]
MERYFKNAKPPICRNDTHDSSKRASRSERFKPYTTQKHERGFEKKRLVVPYHNFHGTYCCVISLLDLLPKSDTPPSSSAVTKLLLSSLKEETNPITHSDLYERTEHVVSMASGHQVSESRKNHRVYHDQRRKKLSLQKEITSAAEQPQILSDVKAYIDGLLIGTTDIEMKRMVTLAGGQILHSASGATHILTSQLLSGSKTHRLLTTKTRNPVHVIKPEWVFDSIRAGKRRPEQNYTIMKQNISMDISMMMHKQKE